MIVVVGEVSAAKLIMVRENQIRDKLAKMLDLIDPNLDLIDIEFHIENPSGTDGYIDILAKDRVHQQLVVIELKKSNQAARQAIHELIKYTALLRTQHGFSDAKVRAILISTEWSELIVPFSAFKKETPFHVDGFHLKVSDEGDPIAVDAIAPLPNATTLELNPSRSLYLFSTEEKRDESIDPLIQAFKAAGFPDFVAIKFDYAGDNQRVIYPYGFYVAASRLDGAARLRLRSDLGDGLDFDEIEQEENPWIYEDEASGADWKLFHEQPQGAFLDDLECSYPEQFGRLLSDWKPGPTLRFGRWQDEVLITEQDIQRALAGVEGISNQLFIRTSSPKFSASWDDFLKGCKQILAVNDVWRNCLFGYLNSQITPESTVSISTHCPDNIIGAVTGVAVYGEPVVLPWFEAVITDGKSSKFLRGTLRWTGDLPAPDPRTFFDEEFGGLDEVIMRRFMGDYSAEPQILSWLRLEYFLFEASYLPGSEEPVLRELSCESSEFGFKPYDPPNEQNNLLEYFKSNAAFLSALNDLVSENVLGEQLPETSWISTLQ